MIICCWYRPIQLLISLCFFEIIAPITKLNKQNGINHDNETSDEPTSPHQLMKRQVQYSKIAKWYYSILSHMLTLFYLPSLSAVQQCLSPGNATAPGWFCPIFLTIRFALRLRFVRCPWPIPFRHHRHNDLPGRHSNGFGNPKEVAGKIRKWTINFIFYYQSKYLCIKC